MIQRASSRDDERRKASWDLAAGAENYLVLVVGQLSSALFSFWALSIISHRLAAAGYGQVVAVLAVSQAVAHITLHWTVLSLYRHGCEEFVETGRLASSFWTRFVLLVACGGVVAGLSPLWFAPLASWLHLPPAAAWLVPVHVLGSALSIHVQYALLAAKLPRFQALAAAVSRGLLVLVLILCARNENLSWQLVTMLYALTPLVEASLGFVKLLPSIYPGVILDRRLLVKMVRFSLPLTAHGLLGYLVTNYLDAFFILKLLSSADLGIYTLAYQLAGTFMQLASLAGSLLLSLFVTLDLEGKSDRLTHYFRELLPVLALLWSGISVAFAAAGSLVIPMFFGPSFSEAAGLLWPMSAAAALAGPMFLGFGALINARSATFISAYVALASALTNIVLNALLIPHFGLTGCAWATVAAYGTGTGVAVVLSGNLVAVRWRDYALVVSPALLAAAIVPFGHPALGVVAGLLLALALGFVNRRRVRESLQRLSRSFLLRFRPEPVMSGSHDV